MKTTAAHERKYQDGVALATMSCSALQQRRHGETGKAAGAAALGISIGDIRESISIKLVIESVNILKRGNRKCG